MTNKQEEPKNKETRLSLRFADSSRISHINLDGRMKKLFQKDLKKFEKIEPCY